MNTIKNLLEFQMLMLENVFEDDVVFRKELKKSKKWLNVNDLITLKKWLLGKFHKTHCKSIHEELKEIPVYIPKQYLHKITDKDFNFVC